MKPLRNIARLTAGDFLARTLSFIAFVYLARVLGVTSFGVLEFASSVLTYLLLLADAGIERWGTREAAKTGDVRQLVARVVPLRLLLATGAFVFILATLSLFPAYPHLRTMLVLFALTLFPQAMNLKWVFMGEEKMSAVARGLVLAQVIFAGAVAVFIHSPERLVWVPVLRLVSDSAATAYFVWLFKRAHGGFGLALDIAWVKQAIRPALTMGISQAMGLLNYNFDSVLLGFLSGAMVVGWYNAAYKPVIIALALPMTYFLGLYPALARSYVADRDEFRGLVRKSVELSAVFVVPLVVGGMLLADPIIGLLYGANYASSAAPFRILVWSAALVILRSTYAEALRATGHHKLDLRCALVSASLNVGLNLLLIPPYGMMGAASATVAADVVWLVMAYYYFRGRVLPEHGLPVLRGPVIGGIAMGLFLWFAEPLFWLARVLGGLAVYVLVLVAADSEMRSLGWLKALRRPKGQSGT